MEDLAAEIFSFIVATSCSGAGMSLLLLSVPATLLYSAVILVEHPLLSRTLSPQHSDIVNWALKGCIDP